MYNSIITSYWTLPTVLILLGGTLVSAVPLTWTIPAFDPDNDAFVLPESIIPTQYILSLVPDIKSKKFHGEVDILGQTDDTGSEVSRVVLNADDIKVKSVQMVDLTDGGKKVEIRDFLIKRIPQWLVVTPVQNLTANSDYQLRIKFEGNFGIEAGMYHASYDDDYTKIGGDVVLTEFQTTYARKVFPCWDEPKYKASFIIKVARYPDQISLSNMPLKSTSVPDSPHEDNRVWDTFEESPDMSTYLVAVVVADLVSISDPERNLSIWTQPDAAAQQGAQYGLNLTGRLMDQMEQWTAIDYTLPKLDQVALPKLRHQAMEHWGVIAFSERFLVVDDMDSLKQKQQVAFHICHELKRFLMTNSSGEQSAKSPRWWIPLSYTTSTELDFNDTRPREWFNVSNAFHQVEINLDDDEWIMFNIQLAGFYRVNYDPHTWNLLIDDMISCEFADIHPLNRAQLLDDAFTLASAGYLNYTTALNLSQYLAHETDIIPWTTAFDIFKTLEAKLIGTPARPLFRRYIQMLVSNWYSSLSFDDDTTPECDTSQLTRMTVVALACGFGHHGCVDRALKQVYLLMSEAETQIPTDLEDILLCTAVNAGPEEVWQFVRKQYMSTTSRKKRESYLEAMACSQDPSKIMQMLEDSLDVKSEFFKNNEGNTLIGALVRRKTNSETMLNFFYKNAEEISALYGPEDLQNYFMFATLHMNPIQIDELHSFMEGKMKQLNLTGINKVFSIEKYISI
ncbi:aminopeptidase Q-like [Nilaparvata lugens]|uniref:aminopeptidase Q-like n=1 Tax=Nilaparvata lugens TaxID=108931 RepID=UPI00193D7021|nr:aminopeptidase Q-like [Nilaparvata lugens]